MAQWQRARTPDAVLKLAIEGNRRFVGGKRSVRNYRAERRSTAAGQHPAAIVLSCIDSRVPAEIIFGAGIGDMLNVRVPGNYISEDVAGAIELACLVLQAKLVLVMGHTDCGAIRGAVDGLKLRNLTGTLRKLRPAVDATGDVAGGRTSENQAFLEAVASENVRLCIKGIRRLSPELRSKEESGAIRIVGAMYDVGSGRVTLLDLPEDGR